MDRFISDGQWRQLAGWITSKTGLYLPTERMPDLKRRLLSAAGEFHFESIEAFVPWLLSTKLTQRQVETLASHLTVGETYFFRETASLEALERYILPHLIASRQSMRYLRIWSAGCATGEEPYTIAILLHRLIPDIRKWQITLLATDINPRFLEKAKQGIYREWSFRGDFQWLKDQYFTKTLDGRYRIAENIRKMVSFNYLNLATDLYPSLINNTNAMDVIFCRNVLMYLEPSLVKRVVRKLYRALVDDGWVLPSVTEGFHLLSTRFAAITFPGVTLYQKRLNHEGTLEIFHLHSAPGIAVDGQEKEELLKEEPPPPPVAERIVKPLSDRESGANNGAPPSSEPRERVGTENEEDSLYEKALRLFRQGDFEESEKILMLCLDRDPGNFRPYELLARLYANQGHLSEARAWCDKALALNKLDAGCHYLKAIILIEQRLFDEAEQALRHVLYLDADFIMAHFTLGNLVREAGRRSVSSRHFEHALLLLKNYAPEDILPESDGVTAGRLKEIILTLDFRRSVAPE